MTSSPAMPASQPPISVREWKALVAPFQIPSIPRSVWQMVNTLVPYALTWYAMYLSLSVSYWLTLALSLLAGLFTVRAFIIFHDCGHGSFFKSQKANSIVGFICGIITFTPYSHWTWQHSVHHATSGDLDRRGDGDIWTMTVKEYQAATPKVRFLYRLSRNPLVLFILAPLIMFLIYQRFPSPRAKNKDRASVLRMNLALAVVIGSLCYMIGWQNYLMIQLPITMVAGASGIWMFYVQHQYEDVYWEHHDNWDYTTAALEGSSYYKLPKIFQWFTGNIGFHHIHHLGSKIPNYYLERCHYSHPIFYSVKPITFLESLKCIKLRLWDEKRRKLIGWKEYAEVYGNKAA